MDYIPLIHKGSVRVYEKDPKDGREILLYYVKENEPCLFSYFTIYEDSTSDCYGTTQEDCKLLMIPKDLMISWQLKYFSWHKYICNTYLKKFHLLIDAIKHNNFSNLEVDNPVAIGFIVNFGEISYLVTNKKNRNDQEPGIKLKENFIEKVCD
jgi:signal-transduction protein with cAMP-binding, CBS, and nucleotidyltransferase domain